ncbi:MAG: arginase [Alphaproteobacteria bacterium]
MISNDIQQNAVTILSAAYGYGQPLDGVERGPEVLWRDGWLQGELEQNGCKVNRVVPLEFDHSSKQVDIPHQPGTIRNGQNAGPALTRIADSAYQIMQSGETCLTLGGDHAIALGTVAAALKATDGNLSVIWVDAHGDYNTPETSPSGNLHGMPLAALCHAFDIRAHDGFADFPDFPALKPENLALVGIRELDAGERDALLDAGVRVYTTSEIDRYGIGKVMDHAIRSVNPYMRLPMHLSYDVDGLDPTIAPATGTRVPGGLTYREAHFIAERMAETGALMSLDVVEVNPALQGAGITADMAIELIQSACGRRIFPNWLKL